MYNGPKPKFDAVTAKPSPTRPTNPKEGMLYTDDGTSRQAGLWQYLSGVWTTVTGAGASLFTPTTSGTVNPPGTVTGKFLKDDNTWAVPSGGGGSGGDLYYVYSDGSGTRGQTAGSFDQRPISAVTGGTSGSITRLGNEQLRFAPGTYRVNIAIPYTNCNSCTARFRDIAVSGTDYLIGTTGWASVGGSASDHSYLVGDMVIASTTDLALMSQVQNSYSLAWGAASSIAAYLWRGTIEKIA